jgi:Uma2 family endonuclease
VLANPRVIFEVLSKSTERRDRGWKFKQCRRIASLTDFLLVSQNPPYVEHYVRPPGGKFELGEAEGLDATLTLAGINCELSLRELYQDILLDADDEMPPEAESAAPGE